MPLIWFVAAISNAILLIIVVGKRKSNEINLYPMIGFVTAQMAWVTIELLIQLIPDVKFVLFIHEAKYVFILAIPSMFLMFVRYVIGRTSFSYRRVMIFVMIEITFLILIASNPWHHLFRRSVTYTKEAIVVVSTVNGPLYYGAVLYLYGLIIYTLIILIRYQFSIAKLYRKKFNLIIWGIILAFAINILFQYAQINYAYNTDYTPLSFGIIAWIFFYSLFWYKQNNLSFEAKEIMLQNLDVGVIYLDENETVFYANRKAIKIMGAEKKKVSGRYIMHVSKDLMSAVSKLKSGLEFVNLKIVQERIYVYRTTLIQILDDEERYIGSMVQMIDITDAELERVNHENQKVLDQQ